MTRSGAGLKTALTCRLRPLEERIDAGEGSLNTEGAIAKYMSTEAGNAAAEASIQALGGYGYTHEYLVEKINPGL